MPAGKQAARRALFASIASGCAMSLSACGSLIEGPPDPPQEPAPEYEALIKATLEGRSEQLSSEFARELTAKEISPPVLELSDRGWAWKSCLRADYRGGKIAIAFFMRGQKVLATRVNVFNDCMNQNYKPLN